jgi:hypothetical protein
LVGGVSGPGNGVPGGGKGLPPPMGWLRSTLLPRLWPLVLVAALLAACCSLRRWMAFHPHWRAWAVACAAALVTAARVVRFAMPWLGASPMEVLLKLSRRENELLPMDPVWLRIDGAFEPDGDSGGREDEGLSVDSEDDAVFRRLIESGARLDAVSLSSWARSCSFCDDVDEWLGECATGSGLDGADNELGRPVFGPAFDAALENDALERFPSSDEPATSFTASGN